MVLPRVSARWTGYLCKSPSRTVRSTVCRRTGRQSQRRAYASEGGEGSAHGAHKSGGDLPWAITSTVITVPCFWYLLQPQLHKAEHTEGHGHGGHDEHAKELNQGEEGESEGSKEEKSEDQGDGNQGEEESGEGDSQAGDDKSSEGERDGNNEDGSEDSKGKAGEDESRKGESGGDSSDSESESGKDTPETSDDEDKGDYPQELSGGGNVEGVQFKGSSNTTEAGEQSDTRKRIPDAKGGFKKRIESHYGQRQGVAEDEAQDPENKDLGATSKPPGGFATQSGKQEGLSNTDTKHSTDIVNNPDKSTKGEGQPETAKMKGTVDPSRPQK